VITEGKKYRGIYRPMEGNLVRSGASQKNAK